MIEEKAGLRTDRVILIEMLHGEHEKGDGTLLSLKRQKFVYGVCLSVYLFESY